MRSEEHTSELQSRQYLVCRLLLEKKKEIEHPTSSTLLYSSSFFFNSTATTEIYTLSLHDALPIFSRDHAVRSCSVAGLSDRISRISPAFSLSSERVTSSKRPSVAERSRASML